MLENLSLQQVSLALECLANEELEYLPEELQKLSPLDWFLLEQLLENLLKERRYSQVH